MPEQRDILESVILRDPRYHKDAYFFVREALDYTQKRLAKNPDRGQVRHITGQELLEGIKQFALQQYGPLSKALLNEWGIYRCEDFGEIVFNLIEFNILAKREEDKKEDFSNGFDFRESFELPFLPANKRARYQSTDGEISSSQTTVG